MSGQEFENVVIAASPGWFGFAGIKAPKAALEFGGRIVRSDTTKLTFKAHRNSDGIQLTHTTAALVFHFEPRRYRGKEFRWAVNNWWGTMSEPEIFLRESSLLLNTEATQAEAEARFQEVCDVWRKTGSVCLPHEPIIWSDAKPNQARRNGPTSGDQARLAQARAKYLAGQFPHTSKAFLAGKAEAATKAFAHEIEIAGPASDDPIDRAALAHFSPEFTLPELASKIEDSLDLPEGDVKPDTLAKLLSRKYNLTAPRGVPGPRPTS